MTDDPNDQPARDPLEDTQPFSAEEPADEAFEDEDEAATEPEPQPAHGATRRGETHRARMGPGGPAGRARTRTVSIDPSLRIRDRVSEWFVIGTVLIFAAIFLNALAFGHGGALSPSLTPPPSVEASVGPTATPEPTPVPIQTPFSVPTPTAGPSESPTEAPTAAPTAAPSEAPTAAPASS